MPSFYVPQLRISDRSIQISGEEFHHLYHVARKKKGDEILLTSGKGLMARARITSLEKGALDAEIISIEKINSSKPILAAAFSLLKNKHDHLIIEKLTELGVKEFFPIIFERTIRKNSGNLIEKFNKVAVAAIKQCDNAHLPRINPVSNLTEIVHEIKSKDYELITALEHSEDKLLTDFLQEKGNSNICFMIGPEGGFSSDEISFLKEQNSTTFTLGNHVLRAETAAISLAAQIIGYYLQHDHGYY